MEERQIRINGEPYAVKAARTVRRGGHVPAQVGWPVLTLLLGALLLKMAMEPTYTGMADYITAIVMNLCIGLAMLFVPWTCRSLINDGMESAASAMSAVPAMAASRAIKGFSKMATKKAAQQGQSFIGFASRPARNLSQRSARWAEKKTRFKQRVGKPAQKTMKEARNWYSDLGLSESQKRLKTKNMRRYYAIKNKHSKKSKK